MEIKYIAVRIPLKESADITSELHNSLGSAIVSLADGQSLADLTEEEREALSWIYTEPF